MLINTDQIYVVNVQNFHIIVLNMFYLNVTQQKVSEQCYVWLNSMMFHEINNELCNMNEKDKVKITLKAMYCKYINEWTVKSKQNV